MYRGVPFKVTPRYPMLCRILTLAGARAQYAGDEVAAKIFADPGVLGAAGLDILLL